MTATEIMLLDDRVRWWPVGMVDPLQEMFAGTWKLRVKEIEESAKEFVKYVGGMA